MSQPFLTYFREYKSDKPPEFLADAQVLSAELARADRSMDITLALKALVPAQALFALEGELRELYGAGRVTITPRYKRELFKAAYMHEVLQRLTRTLPICLGFFDGCAIEADGCRVVITLKGGGADLLAAGGFHAAARKLLRDEFAADFDIELVGTAEPHTDDKYMQRRREAERAAAAAVAERAQPGKRKGKAAKPKAGAVLYGRTITAKPQDIVGVNIESGGVTVCGLVFKKEIKETRDGRRLIVAITITDHTSSVTLKLFDEKAALKRLCDAVSEGDWIIARGVVQTDKYLRDDVLQASDVCAYPVPVREDTATEKRIELHLHTNMSAMDALTPVDQYIKRAAQWGHEAIAITDHGVVQSFPAAMKAAKGTGIKVLYGVEGYVVDDTAEVASGDDIPLDGEFVVFDIETTGLYPARDGITEIGAVRVRGGEVLDEFHTMVNPGKPIPPEIVKLTGITDAMVKDAPAAGVALRAFLDFAGGAVLVAHNAAFDMGFITAFAKRFGYPFQNRSVDTVPMARYLYPELKNHKLNTVAAHHGLTFDHHRASDDARVLAHIFLHMTRELSGDISNIGELNNRIRSKGAVKGRAHHIIILAKNREGLRNLYTLISQSHLRHFERKSPRMPKSLINKHREGLILGSACEAGEVYSALVHGDGDRARSLARYYDYLEIQPATNNAFLIGKGAVENEDGIRALNRQVVAIAREQGKPFVATSDAHYLDPEQEEFRRILLAGQGYDDADRPLPLYLRTTDEMLSEFAYLGERDCRAAVIENPKLVADMCGDVRPIDSDSYNPEIEGARDEMVERVYGGARALYGDPLPDIVRERVELELDAILKHDFATMYIAAQRLVEQSMKNGYLVGSRGSVGSSLLAFLLGITEINALCPHYICERCKFSEFMQDGEYEAGVDLPPKDCPGCGAPLRREGFDTPFEIFLGFDGDKRPDIDLNFSGEYQAAAHKFTEDMFGAENVFKAGTIGTMADKTAFGYVKKYLEERGRIVSRAEEQRLIAGITGVKRSTGQHPGGMVVVPRGMDINIVTPVQHPADKRESGIVTTHFDYHSIEDNLFKLDILGHDAPTMLRMLQDMTGVDPMSLPLCDPDTMELFLSTKTLGFEDSGPLAGPGTVGIPEFGTQFVRQMLVDTKPSTMGELVRISGLSHGTDVWVGNAKDLVDAGTATLKSVVCAREDMLLYLIRCGLPKMDAFNIMESVRKGKGMRPEWEELMRSNKVPEWYIASCGMIKYLFPRAHAAAYVSMSLRIAYFKVHYPEAYYAATFSLWAGDFDATYMTAGESAVRARMDAITKDPTPTPKDKQSFTLLENVLEFYLRGLRFAPIDLYASDSRRFVVTPGGLLPPLCALPGVGEAAAGAIAEARSKGEFISKEELLERARISRAVLATLDQAGVLARLPDTSQTSLFD